MTRRPLNVPTDNVAAHVRLLAELQRFARDGFTYDSTGIAYSNGENAYSVRVHPIGGGQNVIVAVVRALCQRVLETDIPPANARNVVPDLIMALLDISWHAQGIQECLDDIRKTHEWLREQHSHTR